MLVIRATFDVEDSSVVKNFMPKNSHMSSVKVLHSVNIKFNHLFSVGDARPRSPSQNDVEMEAADTGLSCLSRPLIIAPQALSHGRYQVSSLRFQSAYW